MSMDADLAVGPAPDMTGGMRNASAPTPSVFPMSEAMRPTVVGRDYVVTAGHPIVAQIMAGVLERGGTAIDAGVAGGLASAVLNSDMCNLGGIAPILVRPAGSAEVWQPTGQAGAWQLSSILEPFKELKAKMQVLTNLENGSSFNANGSASVEPSHGRQPGAWLTCVDPESVAKRLNVKEANGVSVDQIMAAHQVFAGKTKLPSLQIGLSTVYASCDGKQCSNSRSVSWRTETQPTYKQVDPLAVFNSLTGGAPVGMPGMPVDDAAAKATQILEDAGEL